VRATSDVWHLGASGQGAGHWHVTCRCGAASGPEDPTIELHTDARGVHATAFEYACDGPERRQLMSRRVFGREFPTFTERYLTGAICVAHPNKTSTLASGRD
jgi:hypothetical protein